MCNGPKTLRGDDEQGPKSVKACQAYHIILMVIAVKTMPKQHTRT